MPSADAIGDAVLPQRELTPDEVCPICQDVFLRFCVMSLLRLRMQQRGTGDLL
jgi:hypothetical protein